MSQTYITKAGDSVDWIAFRQYASSEHEYIDAVIDANPGLADYGPTLPAGLSVILPSTDTSSVKSTVNAVTLWS